MPTILSSAISPPPPTCCMQQSHMMHTIPGCANKQHVLSVCTTACVTVCAQGQQYPSALLVHDFTMDVPLLHEEGRGHRGGYVQRSIQATRLCQETVSEECLRQMGADACIAHAITQSLLAGGAGGTPAVPSSSSWSDDQARTVAIAVPVAVVAGACVFPMRLIS